MPRTGEAQLHLARCFTCDTLVLPDQILHVGKSGSLENHLVLVVPARHLLQDAPQVDRSYDCGTAFVGLGHTLPKGRRGKLPVTPVEVGIETFQFAEVECCQYQVGTYQDHRLLRRKHVFRGGELLDVEDMERRLWTVRKMVRHLLKEALKARLRHFRKNLEARPLSAFSSDRYGDFVSQELREPIELLKSVLQLGPNCSQLGALPPGAQRWAVVQLL